MTINVLSNIWKIYILKGLRWFLIIMPIIVLFYQENGLTMKEVLLLQSLFSIAIILFEIPSGYFSDVIGRKTTLIIACVLSFIGMLIYSFSFGFFGFLIAELILGFSSSLISGTDSAMIYDSLKQAGNEDKYKRIEGRMLSIGHASEGIASIFGGLAAVVSLRFPFYIETAVMFLAIPLAFTLIEPIRTRFDNSEGPFKGIMKIVHFSMEHIEIRWLILYSGLLGASTLTLVWFIQPYFNLVGIPLVLFGLFWAGFQFSVSIFTLFAEKYEDKLGRRNSLISMLFLIAIGYLLLSWFNYVWSIVFILLFYIVRGVSTPILKDYINKLISSDMRATVLSVKNLVGRLIFAVVGPFIGWFNDIYSLPIALLISGAFFLLFGIIPLIYLDKHKVL